MNCVRAKGICYSRQGDCTHGRAHTCPSNLAYSNLGPRPHFFSIVFFEILDHAAKARIRSTCLGSTKIRAYMNTTPQSPGRLLARPVIQITGHSVSGVALAARTPRRQRVPLDPARCLLNPGAQSTRFPQYSFRRKAGNILRHFLTWRL